MNQAPVTIISPCYNENVTVIKFLQSLENNLAPVPWSFHVVIVNDCSADNTLSLLQEFKFTAPNLTLRIVNLNINVGHQQAIYQGLLFARDLDSIRFIVMDSDGEDAPATIPRLLEHTTADIVNVVRSNRKESVWFRFCYRVYKFLFRLFTGQQMNYGNFCLISRPVLEHAVSASFTHFAAFLSKQECRRQYIVAKKEARLGGRSKMGFRKLIVHAISSFIEYSSGRPHLTWSRHNPHPKTPVYEILSGRNTEEAI